MSRPPWPARWGIFDRPTVSRQTLASDDPVTYTIARTGSTSQSAGAFRAVGQTITLANHYTTLAFTVELRVFSGSPDGSINARIYENTGTIESPTIGSVVYTSANSITASTLTGSLAEYTFTFSNVVAGEYLIAFVWTSATTGTIVYGSTNSGADGLKLSSSDGSSWVEADPGTDMSLELVSTKTHSFSQGALLRKDTADEIYAVPETDPTNLFALAAEGYSEILEEGFVMVYELNTTDWWGMMGSRDPVSADVGTSYGIVLDADGNWTVDFSDTSNTRVTVQAVDESQNYAYVTFLSAHIQS